MKLQAFTCSAAAAFACSLATCRNNRESRMSDRNATILLPSLEGVPPLCAANMIFLAARGAKSHARVTRWSITLLIAYRPQPYAAMGTSTSGQTRESCKLLQVLIAACGVYDGQAITLVCMIAALHIPIPYPIDTNYCTDIKTPVTILITQTTSSISSNHGHRSHQPIQQHLSRWHTAPTYRPLKRVCSNSCRLRKDEERLAVVRV